MVIKVKEITIGRGRKWAWDFGNSVGFNVSITIEGTTVKDTIEDMIKRAISELIPMQEKEQERCRDVYDIADLQAGVEFKEAVEKSVDPRVAVRVRGTSTSGEEQHSTDLKTTASGHPVEKLETLPKPMVTKTGKYTWYSLKGGGKVRKCNNEGCDLFLKYSEEKSTYEHWKYDANTKVGVYAQDRCDYY